MRIAVLCHGTVLLPALEALSSQNLLVGIGVPDMFPEANEAIKHIATALNIPFSYMRKHSLENELAAWLKHLAADVVCMMGFPYRIPGAVLNYPKYGFFNFHGGRLPEYAGADPVFWQIKNRVTEGAITVHRVSPEVDSGAVAHVEPVLLTLSDTYGTAMQRLGKLLPRALVAFIQQLAIHGRDLVLTPQNKSNTPVCRSRPQAQDQIINWDTSPHEIDALVRACNPVYNGALTLFRGVPVRVLSVKHFQTATEKNRPPGTILKTDPHEGITVSCNGDKTLAIDIICTEGGFFTGGQFIKLANIKAGEELLRVRD